MNEGRNGWMSIRQWMAGNKGRKGSKCDCAFIIIIIMIYYLVPFPDFISLKHDFMTSHYSLK